jgi:hypothetical protein
MHCGCDRKCRLDSLYQDLSPAWPRNVNFNPNNGNANVNNDNPKNSNPKRGVRRLLRVYLLCVAFIHPPSILPISASMLWI